MEFSELIKTSRIENVTLCQPFKKSLVGILCVSGHHIMILQEEHEGNQFILLHSAVDSVEKKLSGSRGTLLLKCKNFCIIQLEIPGTEELQNVAESIEKLSNIDNLSLSYPFYHRPRFEVMEDGWQAFLLETEVTRMIGSASDDWRLSNVNKNYTICASYPPTVIVPKSVDDEVLCQSAEFRQHNRFPVLSYYHKHSGNVIMRSSQPMTGPNGKRCRADEQLLNSSLGKSGRGFIIDTRQVSHAKNAQARGGGVEPDVNYSMWKRIHQPIERRQYLHESLIKLIEACIDPSMNSDKWLSRLESSNWLANVKDVLTCACFVAQCVDKDNYSILVHGSEGLDSTLQVTSLSQMILDHDCRTVRGFEALIEREWLQMGHPFQSRCAKSAFAFTKQKFEAPVFLLFLDCVWQIWQQFPCSFEFNEDFLLMLSEHAYSSPYGTFLCNNEQERQKFKLSSRTTSLWSYINIPEVIGNYINPLYQPHQAVLWPSVAPQSLCLWSGLFLRFQVDPSPQSDAWDEITKVKEQEKQLVSKASRLRRQLYLLEKEAIDTEVLLPAVPCFTNIPEMTPQ